MNQDNSTENFLKNALDNPEMLKRAMDIAGTLAKSGALGGLFDSRQTAGDANESKNQNQSPFNILAETIHRKDNDTFGEGPKKPPSESDPGKIEIEKHKKLLEAICLYVSPDKKDKIELVIKMMGILELAKSMGLTSL